MTGLAAIESQDTAVHHFPRGRELAGILVFWIVFGALNVTNLFLPPFGDGPPFTMQFVALGLVGSVLWMLVTPWLFWLTSRFSTERGHRVRTILLYLVAGVVLALVVAAVGEVVRTRIAPPRPRRGPPRDRPFWSLVRGRFLNDYTISLAVIAAGVARDYIARYQRRLEESTKLRAQLVEARLAALQSQLNPHFLFNTLNAVSALVDRDPRGVRRMIARLGELLRATLEPSAEPEIPVSRELDMLERYLEILRIRFQGRLETSIDAPAALRDALVPPMILQPLVENAMKHAVSKTSQPSRIDVGVKRDGESLVLAVRDSGAGGAQSQSGDGDAPAGMGIGLSNTRARLDELYGDEYSLTFEPDGAGGHVVTVTLPYHTAADLRGLTATSSVSR